MILEIYGIWATGQDRESEKEDEMGVINKCTQCGKKGLFLPLNNLGHCEDCIKKNKAKRDGHGTVEIMPLTVETEDEAIREEKEEVGNMEKADARKPEVSEKSWITTLLLCIFLGGLGIHRFYVNKPLTGVVWLLTLGCFGIGTIIDICSIASGTFTDDEGAAILSDKQKDRIYGTGVQAAPSGDAVEQLRKLGELRDSGIISDEEFAEKKSILLNKIK